MSTSEAPVERENDPGEQLAGLLHQVARAVSRATRAAEDLPTLPEAQVMVLRRLATRGPMSPAQLAVELQLARPTISNLIRDLVAEGLLKREGSAIDGRSVLLVPTPQAHRVHEAFHRGRTTIMAQILNEIPAEGRAELLAIVPALCLLLERLRAFADARPKERNTNEAHPI